jgi:RHS repeat-associated protein
MKYFFATLSVLVLALGHVEASSVISPQTPIRTSNYTHYWGGYLPVGTPELKRAVITPPSGYTYSNITPPPLYEKNNFVATFVSTDCPSSLSYPDTCEVKYTFKIKKAGTISDSFGIGIVANGVQWADSIYLNYEGTFPTSYDPANPPPVDDEVKVCGSIIKADSGTLIERIPIVGANFSLVYSSDYSRDFSSIYNLDRRVNSFNPDGLSVSIVHYYNKNFGRIYLGTGGSKQAISRSYASGQVYVVSDDGSELYVFSTSGTHLKTLNSVTGSTKYTFSYDSYPKITSITDAYGNITLFNRNYSGDMAPLVSITAPFGQVTTFTTLNDPNDWEQIVNRLITSATNPNGETYTLTYLTGSSLLATFQKPGGQITSFTYDARGHLSLESASAGNSWELQENLYSTYRSVTQFSSLGKESLYEFWASGKDNFRWGWDSSGQKSEHGQFEDGSTYDWTPTQYITNSVSNDGRFGAARKRVSYVFIEKDGVPSSTSYGQTIYGLNPANVFDFTSIVETAVTSGRASASVYRSIDKTKEWASHEGVTSEMTIDANERAISYKTGADVPLTLTYNTNGMLHQTTQGSKNTLTRVYNSSGYLQKVTNVLGQETSYVYDLAGRVTQTTLPNGKVILSSYDANGNLSSFTPPSRPAHLFQFNAMDLIGQYQPPVLSGLTAKDTLYTYNLDKQLTNILRPDGQSAALIYGSSIDRVLTEVELTRGSNTFQYATDTNLLANARSADGIYSSFSYYGRALKSEDQRRIPDDYVYAKYAYTFDSDHRLSSRTLQGHSSSSSSTLNVSYNNDDMPTQIGSLNLNYSYPSGRLNSTMLGNISDVRSYDSYGSLSEYTASYAPTGSPAQILFSYTLTRDNAERITGRTETILGVTDVYLYTYDSVGRLASVTKNSAPYSSYVYDDNGNRTSGSHGGQAFTATFDNQDRVLSYNSRTYSYNANGDNTQIQWNTTQQSLFSYDALGNQIGAVDSVGNVLSYKYDGANRLVQTDLNGTTAYRRIYENDLRIAAQYDDDGNNLKEFVYATSPNAPDYIIVAGVNYRFIKDHSGSPRLIVKSDDGTIVQRLDYTDLGKITTNTNASFQPFVFAGGINQENTNLVKFGARFYDPEIGRWTTKDPILFRGRDANLYSYVGNDPINFIDPSGTTQLDLDLALGWLATAHPELFANNINPKFVNTKVIGAAGETINQGLINIDMKQLDETGCEGSDARVRGYVNILGHELLHAQDWKKFGGLVTRMLMLPSENMPGTRHNMIYNAGGAFGNQYFQESP